MNECPLGAAALAGTSFPIDRHMTAARAGLRPAHGQFARCRPTAISRWNSCPAASICAMHLSRFAEELVIWSSAQFRFVRLSDKFTTGSSIMPQKKNPDAAELIRAKIGRIFGANVALMMVMKGLPLAYSKDMQEDKEQVFDAADNLMLALAAMEGMVRDMTANRAALEAPRPVRGFPPRPIWPTGWCASLGLPFREAHHVTGTLVAMAEGAGVDLPDLSLEQMQSVHPGITRISSTCWALTIPSPPACPMAAPRPRRCAPRSPAGRRSWHDTLCRRSTRCTGPSGHSASGVACRLRRRWPARTPRTAPDAGAHRHRHCRDRCHGRQLSICIPR
jgi:argininosuccinate lyase